MLFLSLMLELEPEPALAPALEPEPALAPGPVLTAGVPDAIAVAGMSPVAAAATAAPSANARNFMIDPPVYLHSPVAQQSFARHRKAVSGSFRRLARQHAATHSVIDC